MTYISKANIMLFIEKQFTHKRTLLPMYQPVIIKNSILSTHLLVRIAPYQLDNRNYQHLLSTALQKQMQCHQPQK